MVYIHDIKWLGLTDDDLGIIDDILNTELNINQYGIEEYLKYNTHLEYTNIDAFIDILNNIKEHEDNGCSVHIMHRGLLVVNYENRS